MTFPFLLISKMNQRLTDYDEKIIHHQQSTGLIWRKQLAELQPKLCMRQDANLNVPAVRAEGIQMPVPFRVIKIKKY